MNRFGAVSNKVSTVTKTMMRRGRHEEEAIAHNQREENTMLMIRAQRGCLDIEGTFVLY